MDAEAGPHTQLIQMSEQADAELVVVGSKRRPYPLAKDVLTIGRLDTCDIVLSDPGVSRKHSEVRREGDEWVVVDLSSTNGTIVNGQPVRRHRLLDRRPHRGRRDDDRVPRSLTVTLRGDSCPRSS